MRKITWTIRDHEGYMEPLSYEITDTSDLEKVVLEAGRFSVIDDHVKRLVMQDFDKTFSITWEVEDDEDECDELLEDGEDEE